MVLLTRENAEDKVNEVLALLERYTEKFDRKIHHPYTNYPLPRDLLPRSIVTICEAAAVDTIVEFDAKKRGATLQKDVDDFVMAIFRIDANKTITDESTGLEWLKPYHSKQKDAFLITGDGFKAGLAKVYHHVKDIEDASRLDCTALVQVLLEAYINPGQVAVQLAAERSAAEVLRTKSLYAALDAHVEGDIILKKFLDYFERSLINDHNLPGRFYARSISLLNSSGMGKSRLLRNIGFEMPSFTITIQNPKDKDKKEQPLPRPDWNVIEFFQDFGWQFAGQVVASAFLSAFFNQLYVFVATIYENSSSLELVCKRERFFDVKEQYQFYERIMQTSLTTTKAAEVIIDKLNSTKALKTDVCEKIYGELRQEDQNEKRLVFLDAVVSLAAALLTTNCDKNDPFRVETTSVSEVSINDGRKVNTRLQPSNQKPVKKTYTPDYLDKTQLLVNLSRFFSLVDGAQKPIKPYSNPAQCIFGIDECRHLDELLTNPVADCDWQENGPKKGLHAFTRVLYDLENLVKSGNSSRRRLWVALVDATSTTELLEPFWRKENHSAYSNEILPQFTSPWHNFGSSHGFRIKAKEEPGFVFKKTIAQLHDFEYLCLFGRGIRLAHEKPGILLPFAIEKLLYEPISRAQPLSRSGELSFFAEPKRFARASFNVSSISDIAYTIASLRFNTDAGTLLLRKGSHSYGFVLNSIMNHMRVLNKIGEEKELITSTPCEPMLAVASLVLLNYSKGISEEELEAEKKIRLNVNRTDDIWKNLLREMSISFEKNQDLINIGDNGELLGRMILTRARDCTLPLRWDSTMSTKVPYTTLAQFILKLVGNKPVEKDIKMKEGAKRVKIADSEGYSEKIIKKLMEVNERLPHALVNFNQFVPIDGPLNNSASKYKQKGPLKRTQLVLAFTQGIAFICHPDEPGIDHVIPIMVPKQVNKMEPKAMLEQSAEEIMKINAEKTLIDFDLSYVGVDNKLTWIGQPPNENVVSPQVIEYKGDQRLPCAAMVITMDVAALDSFRMFDEGDDEDCAYRDERLSGYLKVDIKIDKKEQDEEDKECEDEEVHEQEFVALRIRGLNSAYPNWKSIDDFYIFDDVHEIMGIRGGENRRERTNGQDTIDHHYSFAADNFVKIDLDPVLREFKTPQ